MREPEKVQLNVRISKNLLEKLKDSAKVRGLRLNEYCVSLLSISKDDDTKYKDNMEQRIYRLESFIENYMELNNTKNLSKSECINYGKLLSQKFKYIAHKRMLNREELWEEINSQTWLRSIPDEKILIFKDVLRGEREVTPFDIADSLSYGDNDYPYYLYALEGLANEKILELREAFKKCIVSK